MHIFIGLGLFKLGKFLVVLLWIIYLFIRGWNENLYQAKRTRAIQLDLRCNETAKFDVNLVEGSE